MADRRRVLVMPNGATIELSKAEWGAWVLRGTPSEVEAAERALREAMAPPRGARPVGLRCDDGETYVVTHLGPWGFEGDKDLLGVGLIPLAPRIAPRRMG